MRGAFTNYVCVLCAAALVLGTGCSGSGQGNEDPDAGVDSMADGRTSKELGTPAEGGGPPREGGVGDGTQTELGPQPTSCQPRPATFADGKTPTQQWHVAVNGSDDNGTGTPGKPFASVWKAMEVAKAGHAVRIHAGTYTGGIGVQNVVGTAAAPIWIGGMPGEAAPVFKGKGLWLSRIRYVVLHDMEVQSTAETGVNIDDGDDFANRDATRHVLIERVNVSDVQAASHDCIRLQGVDDYVVRDCKLTRCGGAAVDQVGCHGGLVMSNVIEGSGIQAKAGSRDVEIRGNTIKEPGARGVNMGGFEEPGLFRPPLSTTGDNAAAEDIRVIANLIIGGDTPLAFVGCKDCLAANNTLVQPKRWVMRILQENVTGGGYTFAPCQGGAFINNAVYYKTDGIDAHVDEGPDTAPKTFFFANNLWYATDWPGYSNPTLPVAEVAGVVGQEPGFIDAVAGNFGITRKSAGAGKGKADGRISIDRNEKCYRTPPSIGAYAPL